MTQAERVQQVRKLMDLTQSEMAFHMGVTQGTYSLYEKNRDIPLKYYPMLQKMGVNTNWLNTGVGEPIDQEAYLQFKKFRENSEVSVVDVRVSPNVVLPFLPFNSRQSFARGERIKGKTIIVREDNIDYAGAIVVEARNEKMDPVVLPGDKLLCMPIGEGDIDYVTGVVFVVISGIACVRRINSNGMDTDTIVLTSDNSEESIAVRKRDITYMYRVVCSLCRPIY